LRAAYDVGGTRDQESSHAPYVMEKRRTASIAGAPRRQTHTMLDTINHDWHGCRS
jgi:hypothetical protein